jgi:hypothetical protein
MTKKELREFICDVTKEQKVSQMVEAQINRFVIELGFSYKEIAQALVFYVEVEGNKYDPKFGLGIIPHIRNRANAYFEKKRKAKEKQIESVKEANKQPDIILKVAKIKRRKEQPKIDIENLDVD